LIAFACARNGVAQATLCQHFDENFTPDVTIGTWPSSFTTTSSLGITGWTGQKIEINGILSVNTNFQIQNCTLRMGKNAVIRIEPSVTFGSTTSKYFRCLSTWKGFEVMGGTANFLFNHIEDAEFAVDVKSSTASLIIAGNYFNRNRIGVNAAGIAVNAIIVANEFNSTSRVNGSTAPSFAGVQLTDCPSAMIGLTAQIPGYRNVFKGQTHGIILSNSTSSVGLSTFYRNFTGITANQSNIIVRGVDANLRSLFVQNHNDIRTTRTSMEVFHCFMDSCRANNISSLTNNSQERVHIHDNTIRVTYEPSPTNGKIGISLDRSRFGNDGQFRNTILRNHIELHDFLGTVRGGMAVRGNFPTRDFMRIQSNTLLAHTGGRTATPALFFDISVGSAENFQVLNNTVTSENTFSTGSSRWAFFLHNGALTPQEGNIFWNNTVSGTPSHDDGCCAVHGENAGAWSICNNDVDLSYRGFHFMGNCGRSFFGLNTIGDHNVNPNNQAISGGGLVVNGLGGDNAFLGRQECQSNYWSLANFSLPSAYGAILLGNSTNPPSSGTVDKNRFLVQDINDPHQAPSDRSPSSWFEPNDCLQSATECISSRPDELDERDEWVRNSYPTPNSAPDVEEWQETRFLLSKLMRYPELADTGAMLAFKNAYGLSSAAQFARFDSLVGALLGQAGAQTISMDSLAERIQEKLAEITALDSTITNISELEPGFMEDRAELLGELAVLTNQWNLFRELIDSLRHPVLSACEQFNDGLPENELYEQNQKILNALNLKQAWGNELDGADLEALHLIAQQCIEEAGRTKDAAASMLPPEEGNQYWREDPEAYSCPERGARVGQYLVSGCRVSPNPVSSQLQVRFERPFMGVMVVTDVAGRTLLSLNQSARADSVSFSVAHLPEGAYVLSCLDADGGGPINARFVVVK